ncbi:MAG: 4-(cytidine 5'-diphospho)-2-C-methyl-D-erythritol kinase [Puniceicoccales bacterium]|jgi:4-diphosphocytidyl-2-C-methyl-D-erythritol kinase|nr:4-(cytidine 5'-diphospho)-2-C-methyl-D-erythritol kinase [Puniceicoccales bacterium]
MSFVAFAPAKINLLLAITGVRADGFHSLVSLVAPIGLGDTLTLTVDKAGSSGVDTLVCDFPGVPTDGTNLVLKAVAAFREKYLALPAVHFVLEKRVPHGAGLGGGSSDAASALTLLNEATGKPLNHTTLVELAARLGSDCPLFLDGKPVIMRGRGEQVEQLKPAEIEALQGRRLLLFKPAFGVSTAEAYGAMKAAKGAYYIPEADAEAMLAAWRKAPEGAPLPLFNNMERPVFEKHLALPALLNQLREEFGLEPRMSGSGSACFAFLPEGMAAEPVIVAIKQAWGESAFVCETELG